MSRPDPGPVAPQEWEQLAASVRRRRRLTLYVLAPVDRGKSTLCRFLARAARSRGNLAIVDADPGQKLIGPPAVVSLARPLAWGRSLRLAGMHFVGATTPVGHMMTILAGTMRLLREAGAPISIVDTPGIVQGPGIALHHRLLEATTPDLIAAIGRQAEMEAILHAYRHLPIVYLPASPLARRRSGGERRRAREAGFAAHFRKAGAQTFTLDELVFQGGRLPRPPQPGEPEPSAGADAHVLCGVAGADGRCRGLALVGGIERERDQITLLTAVPRRHVRVVQVGAMRIAPDGREAGKGPGGL